MTRSGAADAPAPNGAGASPYPAELAWHRKPGQQVHAWASALYGDDPLPPFYRIAKASDRMAVRIVELLRGMPGHRVAERVGVANSLREAKTMAQVHYNREQTA